MDDELAAPVKGVSRAFHRGVLLAQRIGKLARTLAAHHQLDILGPVQGLERSLVASERRVGEAYALSVRVLGRKFGEAVSGDAVVTNRLQALTINLLEQINSLDEYMDDPMAFDVGSFPYLQRESERCCEQTLFALGNLHQSLLKMAQEPDDRMLLSSQRKASGGRQSFASDQQQLEHSLGERADTITNGVSQTTHYNPVGQSGQQVADSPRVSPTTAVAAFGGAVVTQDGEKSIGSPAGNPAGEFVWRGPPITPVQGTMRGTEDTAKSTEPDTGPELIKKEDVLRQVAINTEILEKRRRSKMLFQEEIRRLSSPPMSPTTQASMATSSVASPLTAAGTPSTNSRPNSSLLMAKSPSREGQSPRLRDTDPLERYESAEFSYASSTRSRADSEIMIFGPLDSPPTPRDIRTEGLSNNVLGFFRPDTISRKEVGSNTLGNASPSSRDERGRAMSGQSRRLGSRDEPLAITVEEEREKFGTLERSYTLNLGNSLEVAHFGRGVDDEKEAVQSISNDDPEKMLASEEYIVPTPALSVQSFDYQIKHDSSFYKYGGFCDGAKMAARGVNGTMKEKTRPNGQFSAKKSMKCISCEYEIGLNVWERDQKYDSAGIYAPKGISSIRFRHQILFKSHLSSKFEEPSYACIFCIEDGHTLEDHDATVFFSSAQYFAHIAKHPRPLRSIPGFTVLYGAQPGIVKFDLCFLDMKPSGPTFGELAAKLASRPTANAIVDHRKGARGFRERDPEQNLALTFAIGAKIVGITFPPRFGGAWACGYHDSSKAYFPTSTISLNPPRKDDVFVNQKSGLIATTLWDSKALLRDNKNGWLSFGKKERITHIGFPYEDFWCWSGMNKNNVYGLFPAAFVEGIVDTGTQSVGSSGTGSAGLGFSPETAVPKMAGMSLGTPTERRKSVFGIGGSNSKSPEKESHSWGSRLGRTGTSGFSIGRRGTNASVNSASSGKSPI